MILYNFLSEQSVFLYVFSYVNNFENIKTGIISLNFVVYLK